MSKYSGRPRKVTPFISNSSTCARFGALENSRVDARARRSVVVIHDRADARRPSSSALAVRCLIPRNGASPTDDARASAKARRRIAREVERSRARVRRRARCVAFACDRSIDRSSFASHDPQTCPPPRSIVGRHSSPRTRPSRAIPHGGFANVLRHSTTEKVDRGGDESPLKTSPDRRPANARDGGFARVLCVDAVPWGDGIGGS